MKTLVLTALICLFAGVALAGKTYKYRCSKCGLVQEYTIQGSKKCPNDGRNMVRISN